MGEQEISIKQPIYCACQLCAHESIQHTAQLQAARSPCLAAATDATGAIVAAAARDALLGGRLVLLAVCGGQGEVWSVRHQVGRVQWVRSCSVDLAVQPRTGAVDADVWDGARVGASQGRVARADPSGAGSAVSHGILPQELVELVSCARRLCLAGTVMAHGAARHQGEGGACEGGEGACGRQW